MDKIIPALALASTDKYMDLQPTLHNELKSNLNSAFYASNHHNSNEVKKTNDTISNVLNTAMTPGDDNNITCSKVSPTISSLVEKSPGNT